MSRTLERGCGSADAVDSDYLEIRKTSATSLDVVRNNDSLLNGDYTLSSDDASLFGMTVTRTASSRTAGPAPATSPGPA